MNKNDFIDIIANLHEKLNILEARGPRSSFSNLNKRETGRLSHADMSVASFSRIFKFLLSGLERHGELNAQEKTGIRNFRSAVEENTPEYKHAVQYVKKNMNLYTTPTFVTNRQGERIIQPVDFENFGETMNIAGARAFLTYLGKMRRKNVNRRNFDLLHKHLRQGIVEVRLESRTNRNYPTYLNIFDEFRRMVPEDSDEFDGVINRFEGAIGIYYDSFLYGFTLEMVNQMDKFRERSTREFREYLEKIQRKNICRQKFDLLYKHVRQGVVEVRLKTSSNINYSEYLVIFDEFSRTVSENSDEFDDIINRFEGVQVDEIYSDSFLLGFTLRMVNRMENFKERSTGHRWIFSVTDRAWRRRD
jgi:hypothetical protein